MEKQSDRNLLLLDSDPEIETKLPADGRVKIFREETLLGAKKIISNRDMPLAAVCMNPEAPDGQAIPAIKFIKSFRPVTPVYFLMNKESDPPEASVLKRLHIQSVMKKPMTMTEIVNSIFPFTFLEMEKILDLAQKDTVAVDAKLETGDGEMHPILARDLLFGSTCFFDIYLKLSEGKFVKLLKAGDSFEPQRLKSYLEKGVKYFYLRKDAQCMYIQYCDKLTESILINKRIPQKIKEDQVLNLGKEINDFLLSSGCDKDSVSAATSFAKHAVSLSLELKSDTISHFFEKISLSSHGVGSAMLASLLVSEMNYSDRKIIELIALSALLHDVGLLFYPEHILAEDESKLSPEELERYHSHPKIGEELIKKIPMINPLLPQVILQHHERRNRKGFPNRLGPGAISPVAELVGMVDQFCGLVARQKINPSLDIFREMERNHFDSFSIKLVEAFQRKFSKSFKVPTTTQ